MIVSGANMGIDSLSLCSNRKHPICSLELKSQIELQFKSPMTGAAGLCQWRSVSLVALYGGIWCWVSVTNVWRNPGVRDTSNTFIMRPVYNQHLISSQALVRKFYEILFFAIPLPALIRRFI